MLWLPEWTQSLNFLWLQFPPPSHPHPLILHASLPFQTCTGRGYLVSSLLQAANLLPSKIHICHWTQHVNQHSGSSQEIPTVPGTVSNPKLCRSRSQLHIHHSSETKALNQWKQLREKGRHSLSSSIHLVSFFKQTLWQQIPITSLTLGTVTS